jgi:hypothetical protein
MEASDRRRIATLMRTLWCGLRMPGLNTSYLLAAQGNLARLLADTGGGQACSRHARYGPETTP